MSTILFIGAGRHQRRAIRRARELGLRVVAADRNPEAPGLFEADEREVVDFDVAALAEVGRRHAVNGVVTVASDRAVPVVAAVAEELGLPGIGSETAHLMTHKVAMRRSLAEAGVAQPEFAAVRTLHEGKEALQTVGLPAVLKPADSAGQRGLFLLRSVDDLEAHLHVALIESASEEAIVESFHEGLELNGLVVARGGEPQLVTLSDRLRPDGAGFGVALAHVYPSTLFGDALEEAERVATRVVRALGLRDGVAYPQLLVTEEGETLLLEVAARVPAGQMDQVARRAVGVDLVQVALRQALGEQVPDELVRPQFQQPLAISFLTAEPGPLPTGKVRSVGPLERVLAFPGVLEAEVYLAPGDVIDPVQRDGDRKGFVIARGDTNIEALERAEAAATLIDVEVEPE
ncbi:MAG TPA: ATP-grasp domain-containing protein [Gaiellaceae bacterium]